MLSKCDVLKRVANDLFADAIVELSPAELKEWADEVEDLLNGLAHRQPKLTPKPDGD